MSFYYRCMKCRTRNTFKRPLEHYKRQKKCRACDHWRFYVDKERQHRTDYCQCEGYHFSHRKGSPYCTANPNYEFNVRVRRFGENPVDVVLDISWDAVPQPATEEIPF
jgi:hypothetical protein